jgi:hypothetical protein
MRLTKMACSESLTASFVQNIWGCREGVQAPPARADWLKILTLNRKGLPEVAEWLGLLMKGLLSTVGK